MAPKSPQMSTFAVMAHRASPTNTRLGRVLTPAQCITRLQYGDVVLGLLLIGLGAGLMLPTATNSVIGSVPQGDSGMGSASNTVALQVGGELGVAVIGSVMLTRYQSHIASALVGRHVPPSVAQTIFGSLGAALAVAARLGGSTGVALARAARAAFMSGNGVALAVGAIVAVAAAVLVLVALPSKASR